LQPESKNYSSIVRLLARKLECTIDSNSRVLLASKKLLLLVQVSAKVLWYYQDDRCNDAQRYQRQGQRMEKLSSFGGVPGDLSS
jgi:hypothetical protein